MIKPSTPAPTPVPLATPNLPLLPSPTKTPPLPVRRLTPEELASRCERGLCFYYDEKFMRGHRCASRFFLLVVDEEHENDTLSPKIGTSYPQIIDPTHNDPLLNPIMTQT